MEPFHLSTSTQVAEKDIRSLISIPTAEIPTFVVGDRNSTINIFQIQNKTCVRILSFKPHAGTVSSLTAVPDSDWLPGGGYASGGQDGVINVFSILSSTPVHSFQAHVANVCFLQCVGASTFLSSGWDDTAKVFVQGKQTLSFKHEHYGIWALVQLPDGSFLTAGADKNICLWDSTGVLFNTIFNAHNDVMRHACWVGSENCLITIANDGVMKKWDYVEGVLSLSATITVSDTYLYSIVHLGDDYFAIGGEDKCAFVVSTSLQSVIDVIPVPGIVFAMTLLSTGDLAIGSTDGVVRTFTTNQDRYAEDELLSEFLGLLSAQTFKSPGLEEINPTDLEDYANINEREVVPGRFELFKDGVEKILCVYNRGVESWIRVGTLTSTVGTQQEKVFDENGTPFDFCISVQIDDTGATYPLYLNYNDNEYIVARDFLAKYHLPQTHLDEVAKFIRQHRSPHQLSTAPQEKFVDSAPFYQVDPSYVTNLDINAVLKKLGTYTDPALTPEELAVLRAWPSKDYFPLLSKYIQEWDSSISWPLMEILRFVIIQKESLVFIKANELKNLVSFILKIPNPNDFAILGITRILGNLPFNYSSILKDIVVGFFFQITSNQFSAFTTRTQLSYTGSILNLTLFSSSNLPLLQNFTEVICQIINYPMDENALQRVILAAGTISITNANLLKKFTDVKHIFLQLQPSPLVSGLLSSLLTVI